MTQRDKRGDKRPAVAKYHAFKDEVRLRQVLLPESGAHVIFILPMPKSWSGKRRGLMDGIPHRQRPDLDNLIKSLVDAVHSEDSHIWDYRATKIWGVKGEIRIGDA